MNTDKYIYTLEISVRDYELDSEGIVNNAVYQHYLEWTRHEFCREAGFSFSQMSQEGIVPVVNRVEINYRSPLKSGDVVLSKLWVEFKGVRFIFHQDVFNKVTGVAVINSVVSVVCLEDGKLSRGERLRRVFEQFIS